MTLLEKVKLTLRISHNKLDTDILETISTARAEMIRAGVEPEVAKSDIKLVQMAIKTYCQYVYANERTVDGFFKSWSLQLENLRKSTIGGDDDV